MMLDEDQVGITRTNDGFYNLTEIGSACANLAAAYPGLATLIELPHATHEGRFSQALRLGNPVQQGGKPVFLLVGGLHGCEWGSCEILLNLAADLLGAYQQQVPLVYGPQGTQFSAAQVTALLDAIDIVLLPLANPDGLHYAHDLTSPARFRKNRNPGTATAQQDLRHAGVDLNRNFDFLFDLGTAFAAGAGVSASTSPLEDTYHGTSAFSEPETKNVRWLLQEHPKTRWFVDLHTGARDVIMPWGDDEVQFRDPQMNFRNPAFDQQRGLPADSYREHLDRSDRDAMRSLAKVFADTAAATSGTAYGITPGYVFAPSCGTSHDWIYSRHLVTPGTEKTLAFAIEWFDDDQGSPLWQQMPGHIEEVCAGLIAMGLAMLPPP